MQETRYNGMFWAYEFRNFSKLTVTNVEVAKTAANFLTWAQYTSLSNLSFDIIVVNDFGYIFYMAVTLLFLLGFLTIELRGVGLGSSLAIGRASLYLILSSLLFLLCFFFNFLRSL